MPDAFDLMVQKLQIAQNQGHNLAMAKVYKIQLVQPSLALSITISRCFAPRIGRFSASRLIDCEIFEDSLLQSYRMIWWMHF